MLADILETNADEKYEISNAKKDRVLNTKRGKGFFYNKYTEKIGTVMAGYHKEPTDGSYIKQLKPNHVGTAVDIKGHDSIKRVYSPNGKSPTLTTMGGGHREPKVVVYDNEQVHSDRYKQLRDDSEEKVLATQLYNSKQFGNAVREKKAFTLRASKCGGVIDKEQYTYRKLTPLECERLQTVPDNYTNYVSNTQRYKMLGNGFTVEVIAFLLTNIKNHLPNKEHSRFRMKELLS